MEKGLHIGQDGYCYEELQDIALEAEKAGINSFWVLDHLHASPRPDERQMLECWTLLSALASQTKHIRLGALVLNINNRSPALLAKMAATLDEITKGRLDFGVGAGGIVRAERQKNLGYEYEFEAYGIAFPLRASTRIEKLDEGLEIIKGMWTQEAASFHGKHYTIKNAVCLPKPVQKPYPPVWIGSRGGSKMMKLVAKHADGWNISGINTVEEYVKMKKDLVELCTETGRRADEIKTSMNVRISGEQDLEKLRDLDSEGLDLAILRLPRGREIEVINNL
jgi:alkanesulfonate monooxygenase SsuD/methylene tetrahydromethanopterin reductase-like flavin-dependent oxidoreductase (luciferase family)